MTLGGERLNFLRLGSEIIALDSVGVELDREDLKVFFSTWRQRIMASC